MSSSRIVVGHKYLVCSVANLISSEKSELQIRFRVNNVFGTIPSIRPGEKSEDSVFTATNTSPLAVGTSSAFTGYTVTIAYKPQVFDLTAIFGDAAETMTADSAKAALAANGVDMDSYYALDTGSVRNAAVDKIVAGDAEKEIPEDIRNLDGYGAGISDTVRNYIDFEHGTFVKMCGIVDGELVELDEPVETDISEYLDDDFPMLDVAAGDTITFHHAAAEDGILIPMPSKEKYLIKLSEVVT